MKKQFATPPHLPLITRPVEEKDLPAIEQIYSFYYQKDLEHFVNRVKQALGGEEEARKVDLRYLVADRENSVVGVIGFRKPTQKMLPFAKTSNPIELYTLFVNKRQNGIGRALVEKMTEAVIKSGYSEIVLYSSDRWKENWPFYDKMDFERAGILTHEGGSSGQVWRKDLVIS